MNLVREGFTRPATGRWRALPRCFAPEERAFEEESPKTAATEATHGGHRKRRRSGWYVPRKRQSPTPDCLSVRRAAGAYMGWSSRAILLRHRLGFKRHGITSITGSPGESGVPHSLRSIRGLKPCRSPHEHKLNKATPPSTRGYDRRTLDYSGNAKDAGMCCVREVPGPEATPMVYGVPEPKACLYAVSIADRMRKGRESDGDGWWQCRHFCGYTEVFEFSSFQRTCG